MEKDYCGNLRQLQKFTSQISNFDYYSEARLVRAGNRTCSALRKKGLQPE
jgi:hypothetical protein